MVQEKIFVLFRVGGIQWLVCQQVKGRIPEDGNIIAYIPAAL